MQYNRDMIYNTDKQYFKIYNVAFTKRLAIFVSILFIAVIIGTGTKSFKENAEVQNSGYASVTDIPTPTLEITPEPTPSSIEVSKNPTASPMPSISPMY